MEIEGTSNLGKRYIPQMLSFTRTNLSIASDIVSESLFNNVAGLKAPAQVFSCEIWEIFKSAISKNIYEQLLLRSHDGPTICSYIINFKFYILNMYL